MKKARELFFYLLGGYAVYLAISFLGNALAHH